MTAYIVGIAIIVSAKVFPTAETSTFQLLRKSSLPFSLAFLAQELNENDFIPNIYVCSRYKSNTIFLVKINNISVVWLSILIMCTFDTRISDYYYI